jgi:curved DNA-binding protein CbpA
MLPQPDLYRILQVDPHADPAVVRAAYRALARRFHPDGSQPDLARMAALNRAYGTLRDPQARRAYDASRRPFAPVLMQPGADSPPWRRGAAAAAEGAAPGTLDFGRYAGWRLVDLVRHDPDYLRWLSRHSSGIRFRDQIAALLPREPDLMRRANSVA